MLDTMLALAERFNRQITGINIPEKPTMLTPDRVKAKHEAFIEEDNEFLEIATLEDQADALIDGIYFRLGALLEMGVLPGPIFETVHQANMLKERGSVPKRIHSQGFDAVKPEGWRPPNLEPYLTITQAEANALPRMKDLLQGIYTYMGRTMDKEGSYAILGEQAGHITEAIAQVMPGGVVEEA